MTDKPGVMPMARTLGDLLREQQELMAQGFDETAAFSPYLNRRRRTLGEVLAEREKKGTPE